MDGNVLVLTVIVTGLVVLAVIAYAVGSIESHSRSAAWRRIADARRRLHLKEQDLLACLEDTRCADCPVRQYWRIS